MVDVSQVLEVLGGVGVALNFLGEVFVTRREHDVAREDLEQRVAALERGDTPRRQGMSPAIAGDTQPAGDLKLPAPAAENAGTAEAHGGSLP